MSRRVSSKPHRKGAQRQSGCALSLAVGTRWRFCLFMISSAGRSEFKAYSRMQAHAVVAHARSTTQKGHSVAGRVSRVLPHDPVRTGTLKA